MMHIDEPEAGDLGEVPFGSHLGRLATQANVACYVFAYVGPKRLYVA